MMLSLISDCVFEILSHCGCVGRLQFFYTCTEAARYKPAKLPTDSLLFEVIKTSSVPLYEHYDTKEMNEVWKHLLGREYVLAYIGEIVSSEALRWFLSRWSNELRQGVILEFAIPTRNVDDLHLFDNVVSSLSEGTRHRLSVSLDERRQLGHWSGEYPDLEWFELIDHDDGIDEIIYWNFRHGRKLPIPADRAAFLATALAGAIKFNHGNLCAECGTSVGKMLAPYTMLYDAFNVGDIQTCSFLFSQNLHLQKPASFLAWSPRNTSTGMLALVASHTRNIQQLVLCSGFSDEWSDIPLFSDDQLHALGDLAALGCEIPLSLFRRLYGSYMADWFYAHYYVTTKTKVVTLLSPLIGELGCVNNVQSFTIDINQLTLFMQRTVVKMNKVKQFKRMLLGALLQFKTPWTAIALVEKTVIFIKVAKQMPIMRGCLKEKAMDILAQHGLPDRIRDALSDSSLIT